MPKLVIDGEALEVGAGTTILQAALTVGREIPHYCYHAGLSIAGNCRMCLVEVEKAPKLVIGCYTPVAEGMVVHTNSAKVKQARSAMMEFFLINHPLDCPICDQAGECRLQEYSVEHGGGDRGVVGRVGAAEARRNEPYGPLLFLVRHPSFVADPVRVDLFVDARDDPFDAIVQLPPRRHHRLLLTYRDDDVAPARAASADRGRVLQVPHPRLEAELLERQRADRTQINDVSRVRVVEPLPREDPDLAAFAALEEFQLGGVRDLIAKADAAAALDAPLLI